MSYAQPSLVDGADTFPRMPAWVTSARGESPEDVAFLSGAALAMLHLVQSREEVPHALLREMLALRAAQACVGFSGRPERAEALRDEVHFLRPGDLPGPAGATYLHWQRVAARPVSVASLQRALALVSAEQIATWLDTAQGGPVIRAAAVLETVLDAFPRKEALALILADAVLAQSLGWKHVLPHLAAGLKARDLRKQGKELQLACHRAVVASATGAVRMATDLTRRAGRLSAVAPKLRAKGGGEAVKLFLTRDAVTPAALPLSDRAARRLCDRLVALGVVRELTGRDTFRLYGV